MPAASTSALSLAGRLRAMDDAELARLIVARGVATTRLADFFDLAEALLDRTALQRTLGRLDRPTLAVIAAVATLDAPAASEISGRLGGSPIDAELAEATALALVHVDGGRHTVYDAVASELAGWPDAGLPSLARLMDDPAPPSLDPVADGDVSTLDRAASERAFTTTVAVDELVFALSIEPARELAKGGLALPDAKRLAAAMSVPIDAVPALIDIAARADLVRVDGGTWLASVSAESWLALDAPERWGALAASWRARLPHRILDLLADRPHAVWGERLSAYVDWLFPAGGGWMRDRVPVYTRDADLLGITFDGAASSPGAALLAAGSAAAIEAMRPLFPAEVDGVYVQHDLTIVSPGPLAPSADARLRVLADVESRGLAANYRVTAGSLARAFSRGETAESVRGFLDGLSLTGIPQPLDYLIRETAERFGSVRVGHVRSDAEPAANARGATNHPSGSARGARAYVRSDDETLMRQLRVDQSLSHLSLIPEGAERLVSRLDPEIVLWNLIEARYPAAMEDDEGRIRPLEPRRAVIPPDATGDDGVPRLIAALRTAATGSPEQSDAAWIARQLELAIRAKSPVTVTVRMPDGAEVQYLVEPASVGGGRLRARDRRADIERTLPLSHIVAVEPAG